MIEALASDLFRIEIPLPESPLKSLNSYLIKAAGGNLLIDTGFNRPECLAAMQTSLNDLEVDLDRTDLYITHLHADHFGLVSELAASGRKVYFNRPDAQIVLAWSGFDAHVRYAARHGFPPHEIRQALANHPASKYDARRIPALSILDEGDSIRIGDYHFRCIATPGHTRGHMCLHEPSRRILLSGDHVLHDITPNIQCWQDDIDPLADYLHSLEKVRNLEVDLVLPGHRRLFLDLKSRIDQLEAHHRERAHEVLAILGSGPKTAYQTAPEMTWDIQFDSWSDFPVLQKWFATGETLAHLRYLEKAGKVSAAVADDRVLYALN